MVDAARRRWILWSPLAIALLLLLIWLFRPAPVAVDFAVVERGPMQVIVSDDGETRVKDLFAVTAPVSGRMRRIELEEGDPVVAQQTLVALIEPADLDVRTAVGGRAGVQAAEAARSHAMAAVERVAAELELARSELRRLKALAARELISVSELEAAERREQVAAAALEEAKAMVRVQEFELERARAQLLAPASKQARNSPEQLVSVYSPVNGQVLRVLTESEGVVNSGTPLIEVGDPARLEIVVDLLSTDAVNVRPGQRVAIEAWGGGEALRGQVRLVEPAGFTKISALGVEEQRVNVVIDFSDPPQRWRSLGHGYRVEPRIVLWEAADAIKVPLSAVFRDRARWAVFVESGGRARLRHVEVGRHNGTEAEINSGLKPGEQVVLHPSDRVTANARVRARG